MKHPISHALVALGLSYGLSLYFWLGLGTFNLVGFIFVSAIVALIGGASGWFIKRNLWITAIVTVLLRIAVYWVMAAGK